MSKLDDLDLSPRGVTLIDLLGRDVAETWAPFGSAYSSRVKDWTPESAARFEVDNEAAERVVRGATRVEMAAWLVAHGRVAWAETKRSSLRMSVMIVINELRYPREFINEAPREWHCSRCKETGELLKLDPRDHRVRSCARCGAPSWCVQLTAQIAWYTKSRKEAKAG